MILINTDLYKCLPHNHLSEGYTKQWYKEFDLPTETLNIDSAKIKLHWEEGE